MEVIVIKIKRVYEKKEPSDGFRVLIDRLWPRGLSKEEAHIDLWLKEIAPSPALRKWFNHDPKKWIEFKKKYQKELDKNPIHLKVLLSHSQPITLLYSAKNEECNNAVALLEYLNKNY